MFDPLVNTIHWARFILLHCPWSANGQGTELTDLQIADSTVAQSFRCKLVHAHVHASVTELEMGHYFVTRPDPRFS